MSRKCLGWVGKKASDWMGKEEEEENEVVEASAHKKQRQEVKRKQGNSPALSLQTRCEPATKHHLICQIYFTSNRNKKRVEKL